MENSLEKCKKTQKWKYLGGMLWFYNMERLPHELGNIIVQFWQG